MRIIPRWQNALRLWVEGELHGNKSRAARELGVTRVTVRKLLRDDVRPSRHTIDRISAVTGIKLVRPETVVIRIKNTEARSLLVALEKALGVER